MIIQSMCSSFKLELLEGIHNFNTDTFKMALYTSDAQLDGNSTSYVIDGEVSGIGYVAGGNVLSTIGPSLSGSVATVSFNNLIWDNSTITARGGLIYNSSKADRSVIVLDFGGNRSSSASPFTVQFLSGSDTSIIRIS